MLEARTIPGLEGFSFIPPPLVDQQELYEYEQRQERKAEAMKWCGRYATVPNPENQSRYKAKLRCGIWRECDDCFEKRVKKFVARAARAQETSGKYFRVLFTDQSTASKIIRKIGKDHYWRVPREKPEVVLFCNIVERPDLDEKHDWDDVDVLGLDWNELAMTPEESKYTGNLGKEDEREKEEAISFTACHPIVEELSVEDEECAWAEACLETKSLNPSYSEEALDWATFMLMETFKEKILDRGGEIPYEVNRYIRVRKAHFCSWLTGELMFGEEKKGGASDGGASDGGADDSSARGINIASPI
jgi:hypothetical protein